MNSAVRLTCVECAATSEDGTGWRAYPVGMDDEMDDEEMVAVYCPECAERQFSEE